MLDRLRRVAERYDTIQQQLTQVETVSDQNLYRDLMKESKQLAPIVEKFDEYNKVKDEMDDCQILMNDPDMREMAEGEYYACRDKLEQIEKELKILLLPHDPNDDKNVIVEIRGGAGGEEAALFAYNLYRMYTMYADGKRWKHEIINENPTELGGFKEVSFTIEGEGAYSRLKYEGGVHRVQRVPETESQGRIQTSTVTVAILPEVEDVEIEIKESDIKMETIKSSGAGGQHINKTESAVRLIHIPTGMIVECQEERSQYKNRDKAMKLLRSRLYEQKLSEQNEQITSARRAMVGTGDRSERIRTYNFPQGRVTDHRIGLTLYSIEEFMNGRIDEMLDALITADIAAKLSGEKE